MAFGQMKFSDLYGTQLDIELGTADRTQLFTTARRQKAINDAMHNFERTTRSTEVLGTIGLISGTAEYDVYVYFPAWISLQDGRQPSIKRITSSGTVTWIEGDNLRKSTPAWNDRELPGWKADPKGTPTNWYLKDDSGTTFLGFDPAPDPAGFSETWTAFIPYLAASTDMAADADLPFTVAGKQFVRLALFAQGLVHYAAALLEPLRKNYEAAERQMKLYAGYVAQYETKKMRDGTDQVTFARSYFREAGRPVRAVDPHRFP